jgi:hypothetical protein
MTHHQKGLSNRAKSITLWLVKEESERDPVQEARDQQRGERFRQADEDCGLGANQQASEADHKQGENRRKKLAGHVARSAMWI